MDAVLLSENGPGIFAGHFEPAEEAIFENYSKAIAEGNIGSYFSNSMFNTVITVAIVIVISFVTGYCISRFGI